MMNGKQKDYKWDEPKYEMFLFGKVIWTVELLTFFISFVSLSPSQTFLIIHSVTINPCSKPALYANSSLSIHVYLVGKL